MFTDVKLRKVRTGSDSSRGLGLGLRPAGAAGYTNPKGETQLVWTRPRATNRRSSIEPQNSPPRERRVEVREPSVVESLPNSVLGSPRDEFDAVSDWASSNRSKVTEYRPIPEEEKYQLLASMITELPWSRCFAFDQLLSTVVRVKVWVIDTGALSGSGILSGRLHSNNYDGDDWVDFMLMKFHFPFREDYLDVVCKQLASGNSVLLEYRGKQANSLLAITPAFKYLGVTVEAKN